MLILGNGRVITRDDACPLIKNGAVAIDGTAICKVGGDEEVRKAYPGAEYIDAAGGLIMPAFINVHEHIYSSFARGLSIRGYDPKGFLDILDGMWWTIDRNLTLHDTYLSAMATYIDSIKNGVTTVFDHHASFGSIRGSLFEIERAAKETGVRSCLCYEISDRDGMDKARESVMENAEFIRHALKDDTGMIAGMMGMHAQFTISDETMELAAANKPDEVGYHLHVAEGIEDLHHCLKVRHLAFCESFPYDIVHEQYLGRRMVYKMMYVPWLEFVQDRNGNGAVCQGRNERHPPVCLIP